MVSQANLVVTKIEEWIWQCDCHQAAHLGLKGRSTWAQRARAYHRASPTSSFPTCPLRGRRIGALAA
eukprot:7967737-Lingulodinium_polyedra.AAC.1